MVKKYSLAEPELSSSGFFSPQSQAWFRNGSFEAGNMVKCLLKSIQVSQVIPLPLALLRSSICALNLTLGFVTTSKIALAFAESAPTVNSNLSISSLVNEKDEQRRYFQNNADAVSYRSNSFYLPKCWEVWLEDWAHWWWPSKKHTAKSFCECSLHFRLAVDVSHSLFCAFQNWDWLRWSTGKNVMSKHPYFVRNHFICIWGSEFVENSSARGLQTCAIILVSNGFFILTAGIRLLQSNESNVRWRGHILGRCGFEHDFRFVKSKVAKYVARTSLVRSGVTSFLEMVIFCVK